MGWAGLVLALAGGLTFVFTFPDKPIGMGIGIVLFIVGIFAMKSGGSGIMKSGGGGKG
jgi:uncharacterized membrane protein YgaE (UPF0421/DUF939 family)